MVSEDERMRHEETSRRAAWLVPAAILAASLWVALGVLVLRMSL